MLEAVWQDLRFGGRVLRRNRAVTFAAVLALALGIGANTAIFSVVNSVLLRPLPYKDSERIVRIWNTYSPRGLTQLPLSEPEFDEYRDQARSLEHVTAYITDELNLTGSGEPERVKVVRASPGFFPALGVQPELGRGFGVEDDPAARERVVVLSHGLWQRHFGGDRGVIGKVVNLSGDSHTVIGVMPPGFGFPDETDVWVPLPFHPPGTTLGVHNLSVVAHVHPGATVEQADAEARAVFSRIMQKYPEYYKDADGLSVRLVPLREEIVGDVRPALLVLFGSVGFTLLIACANVASLMLARAATRRREISLRMALGASRPRIVRQLLTESLLLSVVGGALGLGLAWWCVRLLVAGNSLAIPRMDEISLDAPVLGFTLLVSLLTGVLFGLAPALQLSKPNLGESLKEGGRGGAAGLRQNRARGLLSVLQFALSVVLLVGAGLMVRSFLRLLEVNPGFNPENVLTMRLSLPMSQYQNEKQVAAFYRQLLQRVGALPGVRSVAAVNQLPMTGKAPSASFEIEGRPPEPGGTIADFHMITPDYFRTVGITLLQGRAFTEQDGRQLPPAVIINRTLARRFWPDEDPLGKRIRFGPEAPWVPVVGVVADIKNRLLNTETKPEMYFPHAEAPFGLGPAPSTMSLAVRTSIDPLRLNDAVKGEIRALDKDLPVYEVGTMKQAVDASIARTRFTMMLLAVFAGMALILAAIGIYGVMSYSVEQRTHEIGVRQALGARPRDIVGFFVKRGVVLSLLGIAAGLAGSLALTRVMASLLYGVSATDAATYLSILILMTGVAVLASYLPARRAAKVDPVVALRHE